MSSPRKSKPSTHALLEELIEQVHLLTTAVQALRSEQRAHRPPAHHPESADLVQAVRSVRTEPRTLLQGMELLWELAMYRTGESEAISRAEMRSLWCVDEMLRHLRPFAEG